MVRLATRRSRLALVQAESARAALRSAWPAETFELLEVTTTGDRLRTVSLEKVDGKGFFTDALEDSLVRGQAQLAVHSLKDLPAELDAKFIVAAVLPREDPRDALVSPHGGLEVLPTGARVGTDSSLRRAQLLLRRPDLRVASIRGNVPTRLAKLDRGDYDALVLAAAGLVRLGLSDRATQLLEPEVCLPAPGQGAIAIEALAGSEWAEKARRVDHADSAAAVRAERAFLAALGGGCETPAGCLARVEDGRLLLEAVVVSEGAATRTSSAGPAERAEEIGREAGTR